MKGYSIYYRRDGRWEGRIPKGKNKSGKRVFKYIFGHTKEDVYSKIDDFVYVLVLRQEFKNGNTDFDDLQKCYYDV